MLPTQTSAKLAPGCVAALISSQQLMSRDDVTGAYTLACAALDEFMRLDAAAVQALNLLPPPKRSAGAAAAGKLSSVHSILSLGAWSKCGSRLLKRWLLQPLTDLDELRVRQDMVEMFVDNPVLRDELKEIVVRPSPPRVVGTGMRTFLPFTTTTRTHTHAHAAHSGPGLPQRTPAASLRVVVGPHPHLQAGPVAARAC